MEKNTKIFIYLFILAILFLVAFLGIIIKDHYNSGKNTPKNTPQETPLFQTSINIGTSPTITPTETITPTPENTPAIKEFHLEIKKDDCKNECANFKKNSTDLRYCQEVCGLIEVKKESSSEECKKMEGLESDYCLRDLAISKNDYKICNEIKDANITKNCQNRITEDIFE